MGAFVTHRAQGASRVYLCKIRPTGPRIQQPAGHPHALAFLGYEQLAVRIPVDAHRVPVRQVSE